MPHWQVRNVRSDVRIAVADERLRAIANLDGSSSGMHLTCRTRHGRRRGRRRRDPARRNRWRRRAMPPAQPRTLRARKQTRPTRFEAERAQFVDASVRTPHGRSARRRHKRQPVAGPSARGFFSTPLMRTGPGRPPRAGALRSRLPVEARTRLEVYDEHRRRPRRGTAPSPRAGGRERFLNAPIRQLLLLDRTDESLERRHL
jgi:hypothetical protein